MATGHSSNHYSRIKRLVALTTLSLTLNACSLLKNSDAILEVFGNGNLSASENAVQFFSSNFMTWYDSANCTSCHGDSGQVPAHLFAVSDVEQAYNKSQEYVNFDDPGSSPLYNKMNSGHNCGSDCSEYQNFLLDAITQWAVVEESAGNGGGGGGGEEEAAPTVILANVTVPSGLATFPNFTKLPLWNLSSLGADFSGVSAEVEMAIFDASSYVLRRPKIVTPTNLFSVKSMQVIINDQHLPQFTTYKSVNSVALAPCTSASTTCQYSNLQPLAPRLSGPGVDVVHLEFVELKKSNGSGSGANYYNSTVSPALQVACGRCHNGTQAFVHSYANDFTFLGVPSKATGGTQTNNNLILRAQGIGHPFAIPCSGPNVSPCTLIQQWWLLEFP